MRASGDCAGLAFIRENVRFFLTGGQGSAYNGGDFWGEEGRDVDFPSQLVFGAGLAHPVPATPVAVQYDLLLVTFTFFRDTGVI